MCYLSSSSLKKKGWQIFDKLSVVGFSLTLCMCSFAAKWIFGCVVKMTDGMKHWWLTTNYKYTKSSWWNEEATHNCINFCSVLLPSFSLFRLTKFWSFHHKPVNDICSTDFLRINLNKMIFATVVKIVLTLAHLKWKKT